VTSTNGKAWFEIQLIRLNTTKHIPLKWYIHYRYQLGYGKTTKQVAPCADYIATSIKIWILWQQDIGRWQLSFTSSKH